MTASKSNANQDSSIRFFIWSLMGVAIYALFQVFYAIDAWSAPRLNRELFVWPATLGLVVCYWQAYRHLRNDSVSRRALLAALFAMAILAMTVEPFHSTDVYGYINRGWQQVGYGVNPYVYTVDDIPGWETDPMITDHWVNNPSPYGFLYLQIARGLTALGGGSPELTLLVFKLSNLLLHFAIMAMIWLGARRLNQPRPELSLYLYAANPLVLIHLLANVHNDIWMGFFLTLAGLLAILGQWIWILPALTAGTLVKYASLVTLPVALLFLWKQKAWKALTAGLALSAAVFFVSGSSYLPDFEQFRLGAIEKNAFVTHGSLHSAVWHLLKALARVVPGLEAYLPAFRAGAKNLLLLGFVVFYAVRCRQILRAASYTLQDFLRDILLMMVVLISAVSLKYYPWYLGMFMPLAFFMPPGHLLRRFVILLSAFQMFSLTFVGQAHILNFLLMTLAPFLLTLWLRNRTVEAADRLP